MIFFGELMPFSQLSYLFDFLAYFSRFCNQHKVNKHKTAPFHHCSEGSIDRLSEFVYHFQLIEKKMITQPLSNQKYLKQ